MPNPKPGESRDDFLDRCIPIVISEGNDPDQAVAICISYYEGEKDKAFNLDQGGRIEYWKAFDRRRESFESKYTRRISKAIREQLSIYKDATSFNDLRKSIPPEPLKKAFEELYVEVGDTFARATFSGFKKDSFIPARKQANWIERMQIVARSGVMTDRIVGIDQVTSLQISRIIEDGLADGLSVEEMKRQIIGTTRLQPLNGTLNQRARRIARTEIVTASNKGSLEGAKSTGLNFGKQWVTTIDGRERSAHRGMNGVTVPNGENFEVNGDSMEYPGDPSGTAKNVINCRCAMVFVTGDEQIQAPKIAGDYQNKDGLELRFHEKYEWSDDEIKDIVNRMPAVNRVGQMGTQPYYRGPRNGEMNSFIEMDGYDPDRLGAKAVFQHEYGHYMDMHIQKAVAKSPMGSDLRKMMGRYPTLSKKALHDIADDYGVLFKGKKAYEKQFPKSALERDLFFDNRASALSQSSDVIGDIRKSIDNGILDADEVASLFGFNKGELDDYIREVLKSENNFKFNALKRLDERFYHVNASLKTKYPEGFSWIDDGLLKAGLDKDYNRIKYVSDELEKRMEYYGAFDSSSLKDFIGSATSNNFGVQGHTDKYYRDRAYEFIFGPNKVKISTSHAYEAFANHVALRNSDNAVVMDKILMHLFPKTQTKFKNIVSLSQKRKLSDLVEDYYVTIDNGLDATAQEKKLFEFLDELDRLSSNAVNNTIQTSRNLSNKLTLQSALTETVPPKGYVSYISEDGFLSRLADLVLISPQSMLLTGYSKFYISTDKYKKLLKYMDRAISSKQALTKEQIEEVFGDYPDDADV